jgi:hypothetical protein
VYYGEGGVAIERLIRSLNYAALIGDIGQVESSTSFDDAEDYVTFMASLLANIKVFDNIRSGFAFMMLDMEAERTLSKKVKVVREKDKEGNSKETYAEFADKMKVATLNRKCIGFTTFRTMQQVR